VLLSLIAAGAGLTGSASVLGLVAVLAGRTLFELYYSIGRGLGLIRRMAFVYLVGSASQLAIFAAVVAVAHPGPLLALLIFAGSSVIPIAVAEGIRPVVRGHPVAVDRLALDRIVAIGGPLLFAHLAYIIWNTADTIWVENELGTRQIGIYSAARNVSQMFLILPSAAYGVVMPRVAELRAAGDDAHARRLVYATTLAIAGATSALAAVVITFRLPILRMLYGDAYGAAAGPLAILAIVGVLYATFVTLTSSSVGWGRPGVYTSAMAVATVSELVYLVFLSHDLGGLNPSTAAIASAASIGLALLAVLGQLYWRPLGEKKSPTASAGGT
jgi:O-antigen/teichoic acid export membrane protein